MPLNSVTPERSSIKSWRVAGIRFDSSWRVRLVEIISGYIKIVEKEARPRKSEASKAIISKLVFRRMPRKKTKEKTSAVLVNETASAIEV